MKISPLKFGIFVVALFAFAAFAGQILSPRRSAAATSSNTVNTKETKMETATFAAGCFWGPQLKFSQIKGVKNTEVGYIGGNADNPTYKMVCSDTTGHAEAVQVEFDPAEVTYGQLLDAFWAMHDPTQVNRQGPDYGSQYRTAIFTNSPEQEKQAHASKAALEASGKYSRPIATEIVPAGTFWKAEDYHQQYLQKRGLASCHF